MGSMIPHEVDAAFRNVQELERAGLSHNQPAGLSHNQPWIRPHFFLDTHKHAQYKYRVVIAGYPREIRRGV
jgi:hypothetical protein